MPPPGGLSDKIGNRYEGRIAVWRLLQLIDERYDSVRVRFEHPGDDHFEWWVLRADDSRTYTQVKRQRAPDKEWTVGTLVSRGVLTSFGERLGADPTARCEFFSTLSASHLQDLTENATMAADLREFETQFAVAKDKQESWGEIQRAWPGITPEQAWLQLQRISVGTIDERTLRDTLHVSASAHVAGSPDDVVARLGEFLNDHLAQELTAEDVWDFLRKAGYPPVDWARDSSLHARIHDITSRYRAGIITDRGPLAEIRRSAAGKLATLVADPGGPAVVTVTADAGLGKTALLGQVLDTLDTAAADDGTAPERPVVLAARLDRLGEFTDAPSLGSALRLPGSPAAVLSRVAAGRPALLVLDQVDAFGAGSGRNPARLEAVAEVLREARVLSVRVLLACRAFDLEVDPRLAHLAGITGPGRHAEGHHVEEFGPLPAAEVDQALNDAGISPTSLTPSLRKVLRTPLHLRMLVTMQQRGQIDAAGITTREHLFTGFYLTVCHEVEARQVGAPVTEITDKLAATLSEHQELSVPAALLSEHPITLNHLISAGWLRHDAGRIAFAHEAFFDFAYAQRHIRSGLSLLDLLRSSEQHLFRRGQVRQILTLEREQDREQYLRDIRDVLAAGDVRPHIKELIIALVTWVPDPVIEEWQALSTLGAATSNPLAERAHVLAAQAPEFSRLLLAEGIVAGYLSGRATADLGARLCQLLVRAHPDDVAELLHPYVGQPGWAGRLARVLNLAPLQDSGRTADLMEAAIAAGDFDDAVRGLGGSSDLFSLLHGLGGATAARGARLVAACLRRRLTLLVSEGAYGPAVTPEGYLANTDMMGAGSAHRPEDETVIEKALIAIHVAQSRRLMTDSMSAPEVLAALAADDPAAFVQYILPVVREAARASRTGQITESGEHDQAFGGRPSLYPEHDPADALLGRLAKAIQVAARAGDPDVHVSVRLMAGSPLATEQVLAAAGFATGHTHLLNDTVSWLETGPYALAQGWYEDPRGLSADAIGQVCAQLPIGQTQKTQERAASYTNDVEKEHRHWYGAAAQQLLRDVPADRLTTQARARQGELDRKFPPRPGLERPSGAVRDISIQSPISLNAIARMTDGQLIGAMRRWSSDEWRPLEDGRLRGGATSVAQVIAAAAQADPDRFTAVLETLPLDIELVYIQQILSGLGRSAATPVQVMRAVKATRAHVAICSREIAWLIGQAAAHLDPVVLTAAGLPITELLAVLEEILTLHPARQPATGSRTRNPTASLPAWRRNLAWRLRKPTGEATRTAEAGSRLAERLTTSMLNQPEYPALRALALLARDNPQAATMLTSQLQHLASNPYLSLRALAIETAATQADQDPHAVMRLVATALGTGELSPGTGSEPLPADARVLLASDQLRNLLLHLCWPHYDLVAPVLEHMLRIRSASAPGNPVADLAASSAQAAQNAAMIAATAACRHSKATKLTRRLARKDTMCRRGITIALAQVLPPAELTSELLTLLARLFDDPDDEVARLAATSLRNIPADADDLARNLLSAAAKARTFTLAPAQVVFAVEHYQGNIPGTVLDIADRFFQLHTSQASNPSGHGFHDARILGRLVISIYDTTYSQESPSSPLASRALNLIDAMILARTYELEERLAQLDR
jgi:hypothetical protein